MCHSCAPGLLPLQLPCNQEQLSIISIYIHTHTSPEAISKGGCCSRCSVPALARQPFQGGCAAVKAPRWQDRLTTDPAYPGKTVGDATVLGRGIIPHSYVIWLAVGVLIFANVLFNLQTWLESAYLSGSPHCV